MANLQHSRKIGAHTNQEIRPDSQPRRTGRKRKQRTLSPEQQDSQQEQQRNRTKRRRTSDSGRDSDSNQDSGSSQDSDSGRDSSNRFPWDSLSRVWLAHDALREFDRRNRLLAAKSPQKVPKLEPQIPARDIEQFARRGGPDLSDLRQVCMQAPVTLSRL